MHATFTLSLSGDDIALGDCNSSNGLFLNGRRIERGHVQAGDVIRMGDTVLLLCRGRPEPAGCVDDLGLWGQSPSIRELRTIIRRLGPSGLPVAIVGATGTGKELVARALHSESGRTGSFLALNCAALPGTLVENALFGHRKGAYTDATSDQDGAFVHAQGGTLFLDEIGDLAPEAQPKLLRAIENGEVTPIGADAPVAIDVRIIVATHVPLEPAMAEGGFREDLYARLAGAIVKTPPLSERKEDILLLLRRFLPDSVRERPVTAEFVESLLIYPWPRNVRELEMLAERLAVLHPDAPIWEHSMLGDDMNATLRQRQLPPEAPPSRRQVPSRDELLALLVECDGNVSRAAQLAQRNRKQVYRWMEHYGIGRGTGRPRD